MMSGVPMALTANVAMSTRVRAKSMLKNGQLRRVWTSASRMEIFSCTAVCTFSRQRNAGAEQVMRMMIATPRPTQRTPCSMTSGA